MANLLRELIQHNGYANSALLKSIAQHQAAAQDSEILKMLHHINIASRHWFLLIVNEPFVLEEETKVPESLDAIAAGHQAICDREAEWISQVQEAELTREIESPFIPGFKVTAERAMLQVCMHSAAHRAQCATRLRELGGKPPMLDYLAWLKDCPSTDWPAAS